MVCRSGLCVSAVKRLLSGTGALLSAAAAGLLCGRRQEPLPGWVTLHSCRQTVTVRAESGGETALLELSGGRLRLTGQNLLYESDSTWYVADCFVFDADRDGADEVMLHVWKPGSFGQYQPFWREPDDKTVYSEHLFIYEWDAGKESRLKPRWMSSAMPVTGKTVRTDAKNAVHVLSVNGKETVWNWSGWGLELEQTFLPQ